jgi:hypothetical protein
MRADLRLLVSVVVVCAGGLVLAPTAAAAPVVAAGSTAATGNFPDPLNTNARYFPLTPGQQFVYEGTLRQEGSPPIQHRVVFTVTDLVKTVGGVSSRVILDQDYNDGELVEAELTFFAQDGRANVWTRGEYPEEYENGKFTGAPNVWITGQSGAKAGILVPGSPRTGTPPFVQGKAPAIEFYDVGKVVATGRHVCVPKGCYDGVVKVSETAPLAPEDGTQLKYYAPRVGLIKVTAQGGQAQETLALTSLRHLGQKAMSAARAAALRLDTRGYANSKDYRHTGKAHRDD